MIHEYMEIFRFYKLAFYIVIIFYIYNKKIQAEVDFDGRALTRSYLEKHDLNALLEVSIFYRKGTK